MCPYGEIREGRQGCTAPSGQMQMQPSIVATSTPYTYLHTADLCLWCLFTIEQSPDPVLLSSRESSGEIL